MRLFLVCEGCEGCGLYCLRASASAMQQDRGVLAAAAAAACCALWGPVLYEGA